MDFLHGRNGAGKDTQAKLLKRTIISPGDMLRGAKKRVGRYAKFHDRLSHFFSESEQGTLLGDNEVMALITEDLRDYQAEGIEQFIFTGFPRTTGQLALIDQFIARLRETQPVIEHHVVYDITEATAMQRSLERKKLPVQGEAPRADDEPEIILRRSRDFDNITAPMLINLEIENRLRRINGNSIEGVAATDWFFDGIFVPGLISVLHHLTAETLEGHHELHPTLSKL